MTEAEPQTQTILIVDDDPEVRHVLRAMLEAAGYSIAEADNGRQALAECRKHSVRVMITDLVMPEREGIETIKMARQTYPGLRIIAISGAFGGEYLRIAKLLGADAALPKPLHMDALLEAVRKAFVEPIADTHSGRIAS
jgi:CheY-like chemotaxis protein